jgi:hypothetical protein
MSRIVRRPVSHFLPEPSKDSRPFESYSTLNKVNVRPEPQIAKSQHLCPSDEFVLQIGMPRCFLLPTHCRIAKPSSRLSSVPRV